MRNQILTAVMTMAALAASPAVAAEEAFPGGVTVCVETIRSMAGTADAVRDAAAIFAEAGLPLRWIFGRGCEVDPSVILVTFETGRPESFKPLSLAYAFPYEGRHIVVMLDRVEDFADRKVRVSRLSVLTYVMAHEAGHQLEGLSRHSQDGIMKAHFGYAEIFGIVSHTLRFSPDDVELMRNGIARRLPLEARNEILAENRQ